MEYDLSMNTVVDSDSDIINLTNIIRMLNNTLHIENEEKQPQDNEEETTVQDIINYRRHRAVLMNTMFNNVFTFLNPNRNESNNINESINVSNNVNVNVDAAILNDSFQQDNHLYKNVISDEGNEELKTIIFSKENIKSDTCPILHTPFEEGEEITQLPCNHVFDTTAINKWLQNEKAECPICRYKMKSKEIKIEQAQAQGATGHGHSGPHATGPHAHGHSGPHAHGHSGPHAHGHSGPHGDSGPIYTNTQGRFSGYYRQPQQIENENSSEDIELQQAILNSIHQSRDV